MAREGQGYPRWRRDMMMMMMMNNTFVLWAKGFLLPEQIYNRKEMIYYKTQATNLFRHNIAYIYRCERVKKRMHMYWHSFTYHHHHHHHHVVPLARISMNLSRLFSLSFISSGRSSGLHPVSTAAVCMFEQVVLLLLQHMRGSIGVHHGWVRPCFCSSVLRVWFV